MPSCRCGLIGAGIATSLSPPLHETEGRRHGLDLTYTLMDATDGLAALVDRAEADGFAGVNITHPFKQQAAVLVDTLSPQARAIGAVNTIVFRDGRRAGHNTDVHGFAEAFGMSLPGAPVDRVVLLGAGGAGAACAYALLGLGTGHLTIVDPDPDRLGTLGELLAARFDTDRIALAEPGSIAKALAAADGLVNASPVGMAAHPGLPLPVHLLHRGLWVNDVIYMPVDTDLLIAARARGLRAAGGAAMCVFQAAAAFELFTGRAPDPSRMLRHVEKLLRERTPTPLWSS
jgi:shikimate dehydrogenase